MKNKRILNISLDPNILHPSYGNAQQRHLEYAKNFEKFVVLILSHSVSDEVRSKGDSLQSGSLIVQATNSRNRWLMIFQGLWLASVLSRRHKIQAVTSQDPYLSGFLAWVVSKSRSIPFMLQLHSSYFLTPNHRPANCFDKILRLLVMWQISQADRVRVVNSQAYRYLKKQFLGKDVRLIPLSHELSKFYRPVNKRKKYKKFICVGRLEAEKNHQMLIESFTKVAKDVSEIMLTIVGDGSLRNDLKTQISSLSIKSQIKLVGSVHQDELVSLYRDHDAFIHASDYEGYGMVFLEAAMAGLPLISTKVGLAGSLFRHEESALLSNPGDMDALAKNIRQLVENPDIGRRLAKSAQLEVKINYKPAKLKKDLIKFFQEGTL